MRSMVTPHGTVTEARQHQQRRQPQIHGVAAGVGRAQRAVEAASPVDVKLGAEIC